MASGIRNRPSARWTGELTPPVGGEYILSLTVQGTARLYLDDALVIDTASAQPESSSNPRVPFDSAPADWGSCAVNVYTATVQLETGVPCAVIVEYAADAEEVWSIPQAMLRLGWRPPAEIVTPTLESAITLARQAEVAIVVARTFESEEMDRPDLRLPSGQDELIRAVATANPRTIVVLMSGGPLETASWDESVPAVLEAWYAGQEQGNAIARILFGDVNPAGKLPLTFPHSEAKTPVATLAQYPGVDGIVHYSEGLSVGYRGYEWFEIEPRYPFGHGLSYTGFAYEQLDITPETDGTQPINVRFTLTNTGSRIGKEIAQIYLGMPDAIDAPSRILVGWTVATLEPGESRVMTVVLDPLSWERPFSYWNAEHGRWECASGTHRLSVGASSRDIRLNGSFRLTTG